jgi:hypothetical protein
MSNLNSAKLNKLFGSEEPASSNAIGFAIGALFGAAIFAVVSVGLAAFAGWLVGWLFPATFAAFMTLIGLGAYQVWQLSAVMAYLAFVVKAFRG